MTSSQQDEIHELSPAIAASGMGFPASNGTYYDDKTLWRIYSASRAIETGGISAGSLSGQVPRRLAVLQFSYSQNGLHQVSSKDMMEAILA